jgi:transcriptional regulator of arginine metabolism
MTSKHDRQAALLRLVRQRAVESQGDLVHLLKTAGLPATQTSVSRDLRELGLVKLDGRYQRVDRVRRPHATAGADPLHELVSRVDPVGANLIVVRTPIGTASAVAVALDQQRSPDIAGTVAGDDTIFIAVRSRSAQGRALALLRQLSTPQ